MKSNEMSVVHIISTLEHVFKNIRYKLLDVNGNNYVYDTDRLAWSFIFPFIHWFIPHPVYQIDETTYEELKMPDEENRRRTWIVILAASMSIALVRLLSSVIDKLDNSLSFRPTILLLFVCIAITMMIRVSLHRAKCKELNHKIELDSLPVVFVYIKPANKKSYMLAVYYYLFSLTLSLLAGFGYMETRNIVIGMIFIAFTLVFSLINTLVTPIGSVKVTDVEDKNTLS